MKKQYNITIAISILFLLPIALIGQTRITANSAETNSTTSLSPVLKKYSLFEINTAAIVSQVKLNGNGDADFILDLPGYTEFSISISEHDILSNNYKLIAGTPEGNIIYPKPDCITYAGTLLDDNSSNVSLTITNQLIYGIIQGKGKQYFIEPLSYFDKKAEPNIFVVYETKDVVPHAGIGCGVTEVVKKAQNLDPHHSASKISGTATGTCKMVEVAIASDDSMYYRYNTVAGVQDHNIAIMNIVVGLYSNAQIGTSYLEFKIVGQYVSTNPASNPLSPAYTGFDAAILLSNFTTWGQAGNFGFTYDIGEFWTTKDIATLSAGVYSYGVVGLAWLGTTCTSFRYHIIEDNLSLAGYGLGLTVAHETGHNFNANHDAAPGFIMNPSVDLTVTSFSSVSLTAMDSYITSTGVPCLSACNTTLPIAQFSTSASSICTGSSVTFTDHSVGEVTGILWDFPGGTPSSSTNASEVVTYTTPGLKTITLTATNSVGLASISKTVFVANATIAACRTYIPGNAETPVLRSVALANILHSNSVIYIGGTYDDYSCTATTILMPSTTYNMTTNLGFRQDPTYNISNNVQVFIDYNNNGSFLDANEAVFASPACQQGNYQFPITTIASVPVLDTWLRLRVIGTACALSNSDGCNIPVNSQTEDYAVYFPSALSVSMIQFDGYDVNGVNKLNWETSAENNNQYFEVERSSDEQKINFVAVGRINSNETASNLKQYSFTDSPGNSSVGNSFYYRLKIVDKEGNYSYSSIITINTSSESANSFTLSPNPIDKGESLQLKMQTNSLVSVTILNNLGQVMYSGETTETGIFNTSIPLHLASGVYSVRVIDNKKSQLQSLMIR